jgi:hypothetical protein
MTRLAMCSPVATGMGATPRAIAAWASTSSGFVGSSIHATSNGASFAIQSIASATSQRWLASDGDPDVGTDGLARDAETSDVIAQVATDLELDLVEARVDGLAAEAGELAHRRSRASPGVVV